MILISHRGNIDGPIKELENEPKYIDSAINLGYDVEIDIWSINKLLFLGHDQPQYSININWLEERIDLLWIHCKNIDALQEIYSISNKKFNYFWHQEDTVTLTSKGFIWAYPGNQPIKNSIAVMPEINNDNVKKCKGICSDYIKNYKINKNGDL
jgi:hypothetical protein